MTGLGSDLLTFVDNGVDFDVEATRLQGISPKVSFKSGALAGYEFTVNQYIASSKTFVINDIQDGGRLKNNK
ncbi:hypothetical protein [Spirosoma validum]|uniref:Uncharacterized protein n=1 Tax=Spirosoma validum TaxID=2771355 RepID=A0A927B1B2_9BACT|nr:hypothetical protein [Spirosoma validum]MBD2753741.1 hypothetical protein [Spirosoma validum]